jgi:hypothetical protein
MDGVKKSRMYFVRQRNNKRRRKWRKCGVISDGKSGVSRGIAQRRRGGGMMEYVAIEELLVKAEDPFAHYLLENKIARHCTHVLSSALIPMPLTVLPAKQNQKAAISFHPLK